MATYTQQDLANIKAIISGGLDQAMIAGEMVRYRNLNDLRRIQAMIEADLEAARPAVSLVYAATSRGL
ncbi:hypothetical protein J4729_07450 [Leisingera sp. HS039]|uniref:phage head-tail joining protein n=1 Tax=Leisingera sp. HS039 TaxID=2818496 RepID=UPI001B3A2DF7|nr:hypothetical protein [Leisingera sp. HS039]MBQ4824384.1 hypothetical protein [Leisingera sp. HS039]